MENLIMSCHLGRWLCLFLLLSATPLTTAEQRLNGTVAEVPDDVVLIRSAEPAFPVAGPPGRTTICCKLPAVA
jgi:hypothetical protein